MVSNLLMLLDRQRKLQGDLNSLQQLGLISIINQEGQEKIDLEKLRAIYGALATNPNTSGNFLKKMMMELQPLEEEPQEEATDNSWITPESIPDIEDFLKNAIPHQAR